MTSTGPAVIIRPPRGGLVFMVAWIGFLCPLMVAGAAGEHDLRGLSLVFVWLPWLVPVILAARACVSAAGDALIYRHSPGRWSHRTLRIEMGLLTVASGSRLSSRWLRTRCRWER